MSNVVACQRFPLVRIMIGLRHKLNYLLGLTAEQDERENLNVQETELGRNKVREEIWIFDSSLKLRKVGNMRGKLKQDYARIYYQT